MPRVEHIRKYGEFIGCLCCCGFERETRPAHGVSVGQVVWPPMVRVPNRDVKKKKSGELGNAACASAVLHRTMYTI